MQLGSLRIIFSSFFLLLIYWKRVYTINFIEWKWIFISALIGSFFPAFLFAFAETEIDSSVASVLNSIVPLNTLIIGVLIFNIKSSAKQFVGVFIGFIGATLLIISGININPDQNYLYAGLVIICSFLYAINVNIIKKYLQHMSAVTLAVGHFSVILAPAILIFCFSDFSIISLHSTEVQLSIFYVLILALFATSIAKVLFNKLIQMSSPVFASSVTYSMLIVSILWGMIDGEKFSIYQLMSTLVIVLGILLTSKKSKS